LEDWLTTLGTSGPDRRRTGGEHPATRQHMPTHIDTRRQGQRYDHSIPAGQVAAVLVSHGRNHRGLQGLPHAQGHLGAGGSRSRRAPSLPAATKAAASSIAVSSAAPIAHHQKKTNTDATSSPSPRPATKAPAQANQALRVSAAPNRCRRCQRPPASSPVPASKGTNATTSTRDKPCPGLIGTSTGPSRPAGSTNRIRARANKLPHPSSHVFPALGAATRPPS
ncbi:MAG: hypothetical protein K0S88_1270, partial [Actinomycetia bacterium]|nr:hypothetical protein [Actinomycetes bacterium]